MSAPLLELQDVSIAFGGKIVVRELNLALRAGERLALVGESGSGKTVTALSILRLLKAARVSGKILFNGDDLLTKSDAALRKVRGAEIAMIFQEPMSAMNALLTIGAQVAEALVLHEGLSPRRAREKAILLLSRTGIREPERRVDAYPHQLSGGERQRAMIAMALACRPKLLIADEPTTALDPTLRARIVDLLLDLQREELQQRPDDGMAILLITHDLPLVRRFAERVAVMESGVLVESGPADELFASPRHPYTRKLLGSMPVRKLPPVAENAETLLSTHQVRVEYSSTTPSLRRWFGRAPFVALASADLYLRQGETVGVVGESGSGKSTLAQAILGLVATRSGEVDFEGKRARSLTRAERRARRARLQVVFQDPFGSLSPRHTVREIVEEGLALHFPALDAGQREERVVEVLREVGLTGDILEAYPHEFSGGQRQRIAIARALVLAPRVLLLDEPTSALDVSIQNQVLELLLLLQKKYSLSYLLISHDLAVINALTHRLYVLKDGEIVEAGDTESVIRAPQHPYTQRLVQAAYAHL